MLHTCQGGVLMKTKWRLHRERKRRTFLTWHVTFSLPDKSWKFDKEQITEQTEHELRPRSPLHFVIDYHFRYYSSACCSRTNTNTTPYTTNAMTHLVLLQPMRQSSTYIASDSAAQCRISTFYILASSIQVLRWKWKCSFRIIWKWKLVSFSKCNPDLEWRKLMHIH